jgi:hypothetical protein
MAPGLSGKLRHLNPPRITVGVTALQEMLRLSGVLTRRALFTTHVGAWGAVTRLNGPSKFRLVLRSFQYFSPQAFLTRSR